MRKADGNKMQFYGIQRTTLLDYPGEVATTIFTKGCNFRCSYCHNPDLVNDTGKLKPIQWKDIFAFLKKRKNVLGGVCITGGEPLINDGLKDIIEDIHSIGLKVKIDTNGSLPERLSILQADYIAMDIKTSLEKYGLVGYVGDIADLAVKIKGSIDWIITSGVLHEFRTTVVPGIVDKDDITKIAPILKGAQKYVLAQFRPFNTLDPELEKTMPYDKAMIEEMKDIVQEHGIICELRNNY
jgi:pyruvate formate lyase activating enzyme